MAVALRALATTKLARFEEKSRRHGLVYPWWIAAVADVMLYSCLAVALVQRDLLLPPTWVTASALLIALPHVIQAVVRTWVPWWITATLTVGGVGWLMGATPAIDPVVDFAPGILAVVGAVTTATDGWRAGAVTTAGGLAMIVAVGVEAPVPLAEIALGFMVGGMLRWLMRALAAERAARAGESQRATLAERQRIAREIHDLVAHSLSVTLLHVAGARRALLDDDRDDALAALQDAERVGRDAMTDIRRTVGLLSTGPSDTHALPGASDVPQLIDDVRAAGLTVDLEATGDLTALDASSGLGLYRVLQESLANVVKHADTTTARVSIDVDPCSTRMTVRNHHTGTAPGDGLGSGIDGMRGRAAQLGGTVTVGPERDEWQVRLEIPTKVRS